MPACWTQAFIHAAYLYPKIDHWYYVEQSAFIPWTDNFGPCKLNFVSYWVWWRGLGAGLPTNYHLSRWWYGWMGLNVYGHSKWGFPLVRMGLIGWYIEVSVQQDIEVSVQQSTTISVTPKLGNFCSFELINSFFKGHQTNNVGIRSIIKKFIRCNLSPTVFTLPASNSENRFRISSRHFVQGGGFWVNANKE